MFVQMLSAIAAALLYPLMRLRTAMRFQVRRSSEPLWYSRIYTLHYPEALSTLIALLHRRCRRQNLHVTLLSDRASWILRIAIESGNPSTVCDLRALLEEYAEVEPFEAQLVETFRQLEKVRDAELGELLSACGMEVLACGVLSSTEVLLLCAGLKRLSHSLPPEHK